MTEKAATPPSKAMAAVFHAQRTGSRRKLFEFLLSVSREDFVRPIAQAGDKSIRDLLVHMIDTHGFWINLLQNRPHTPLDPMGFPTVQSVIAAHDEIADRIHIVLTTAEEGWFGREEIFSFPSGRSGRFVPALVTIHMLTQEYHHKGQITLLARMLGYDPPDLDFIV